VYEDTVLFYFNETKYEFTRQGTNLWEQTVLTMNQRAREQADFVMGLAGMGMMAGGNRNSKGQGQQRPPQGGGSPPKQTVTSNTGNVYDFTPSFPHEHMIDWSLGYPRRIP